MRTVLSVSVSLVALVIVLAGVAFCAVPVRAQGHTHEGEVGRFYQSWMKPDNRYQSCCSLTDCAPVEHVRRGPDGRWQMQRASDGMWLTIPNGKIENYAPDARDSPDGRSHMCSRANSDVVFCAVLGDGM